MADFIESSGFAERAADEAPESMGCVRQLAAINRAGLVTVGSQPGIPNTDRMDREIQRANVDGFLESWRVPKFFKALHDRDIIGWQVMPSPKDDYDAMMYASIPITKVCKGDEPFRPYTYLRTNLTRKDIVQTIQTSEGKIREGEDVAFVVVCDPVWGRHADKVLFPALMHALEKSAKP